MDFLFNSLLGEYNIPLAVFSAIIGIVTFVTYLVATWRAGLRNGNWPYQSISITYYKAYPNNPCDLRWLFQMFMAVSITCILGMTQNLYYMIFVCLPFTVMTLCPSVIVQLDGENKLIRKVHMCTAIPAITLGLIGVMLWHFHISTFVLVCLAVVDLIYTVCLFKNRRQLTYWIEVCSLTYLILGIITNAILIIAQ